MALRNLIKSAKLTQKREAIIFIPRDSVSSEESLEDFAYKLIEELSEETGRSIGLSRENNMVNPACRPLILTDNNSFSAEIEEDKKRGASGLEYQYYLTTSGVYSKEEVMLLPAQHPSENNPVFNAFLKFLKER